MQISSDVEDMVAKVFDGLFLTREEIVYLLKMNHHSVDAGFIMATADAISRKAAQGQAEVHAQIGLNLSPCPKDCSFCSFAASNGFFKKENELPVEEVVRLSLKAEAEGANAIFLMARATTRWGNFWKYPRRSGTTQTGDGHDRQYWRFWMTKRENG